MFTEENLKILVPLFTAMLGYAIGYFVKKSEYERQRRDEVADRDFSRLATIHDRKIQQAQDCINTLTDISRKLSMLEIALITFRDADKNEEDFEKILELINSLSKKAVSISLLRDLELDNLNNEFMSVCFAELRGTTELRQNIVKNQIIDEKAIHKRIDEFSQRTATLIRDMHNRLDELAKTVK